MPTYGYMKLHFMMIKLQIEIAEKQFEKLFPKLQQDIKPSFLLGFYYWVRYDNNNFRIFVKFNFRMNETRQ